MIDVVRLRAAIGASLTRLTNILLKLLRNDVATNFTREEIRSVHFSFSQFGEDLAVNRWVEQLRPSARIYVDVGCFHPIYYSNTLLLYKKGWCGINVDVDVEKIALFRATRPSDHNVVAAISREAGSSKYLKYGSGGTNRLHSECDKDFLSAAGESPYETKIVQTLTLDSVLASSPWPIPKIGYLNIDCEGHDLNVLEGLDITRYEPEIITIEALTEDERLRISKYLYRYGYRQAEKLGLTLLFARAS
jgi:FkbM family methyltransferase